MSISAAGLEGQPQGVQPLHHPAAQACLGLRQGALQEEHHAELLAEIEWRCVIKIWEIYVEGCTDGHSYIHVRHMHIILVFQCNSMYSYMYTVFYVGGIVFPLGNEIQMFTKWETNSQRKSLVVRSCGASSPSGRVSH